MAAAPSNTRQAHAAGSLWLPSLGRLVGTPLSPQPHPTVHNPHARPATPQPWLLTAAGLVLFRRTQGFCDLYGAFGVYEPQRFAGPFGGGAARGCPRVFRLYHSAELLDDERSGDGGSKQSEDGTGDEAQQPQSEQQQLLVQHAAGLSLAEVLAPQAPLFID